MAVLHVDESNFDTLLTSEQPVLIDFWASWCGPCQMIAPIIENLAEDHPQITVAKVNVDEAPSIAIRYGVESIPTLIAMRGGEVTDRMVGVRPAEQILAMRGLGE